MTSAVLPESAVLRRIFLAALAVRVSLVLMLYLAMGNDGLLGADSRSFLQWIVDHAESIRSGRVHGWQWLGPNPTLLPMPSLLWTANVLLFADYAPLTSVLCESVLDSGTCVLVYFAARDIDTRFALPAGVMATLNPTQVVMAGLFYTDTIFLFFVAAALRGAVGWLRWPGWSNAFFIGAGLGGALLSRAVVAPWAVFLLVCLTTAALLRSSRGAVLARLAVAAALAGVCVAPLVARNHAETGGWTLTTQTGAHAAYWVVPLVMQAKDGTSWEHGVALMRKRVEDRYGEKAANSAEDSRKLSEVAREALAELGPSAIAKAWLTGAMINLGAPVATIFPPLAQLPRTGFFATPGSGLGERIVNFLFRSDNSLFAWSVVLGIIGLLGFRLCQLKGLAVLLSSHDRRLPTLLLLSWVGFIILVSGPIASPKYRLPIEPALMVFAGAGWYGFRRRESGRSDEQHGPMDRTGTGAGR
jgi:hypothetical protein